MYISERREDGVNYVPRTHHFWECNNVSVPCLAVPQAQYWGSRSLSKSMKTTFPSLFFATLTPTLRMG
jgi:hypothetical protein